MILWTNNLFFHFITALSSWTSSYVLCNELVWCINTPVYSSAFCLACLWLCAVICPLHCEVQIFLLPAAVSWLGCLDWVLWSGGCMNSHLVKLSKHNNATYYYHLQYITHLLQHFTHNHTVYANNLNLILERGLKSLQAMKCSHLWLHLRHKDGEVGQARSASSEGLYLTNPSENSVEH